LATPQQYSNRHSVSNWSWVGERSTPRRRTAPLLRNQLRDSPRVLFALEAGEDTGTRSRKARAAVRVMRFELRIQPIERGATSRYRPRTTGSQSLRVCPNAAARM